MWKSRAGWLNQRTDKANRAVEAQAKAGRGCRTGSEFNGSLGTFHCPITGCAFECLLSGQARLFAHDDTVVNIDTYSMREAMGFGGRSIERPYEVRHLVVGNQD